MSKESKKQTSAKDADRAARVARARTAILKHTGQKPLVPSATQMAHCATGSFAIDHLIGGTTGRDGKPICPGFPRRRLIEVYGPESSGKTTLLLSAMAQAQKAGGMAMFIDFEHALDMNYARAVGISSDDDKWLFYQPDNMEMGLMQIAAGISAGFDIVGVDSVAGMVPKAELEKDLDDAAKIGAVAAKLARDLPKFVLWLAKYPVIGTGEVKKKDPDHPGTALVFLNQTRALIQTGGYSGGGGDTENTSGGKALKFFSYLRIRTNRIKSEVIERKDTITGKPRRFPYGNLTDVKVVKSKIDGKQGHSTNVFIRYGFGIDDYYSIIETGVVHKLIKKEGAYYILGNERYHGKDKLRSFLVNNPKAYEDIRGKILTAISSTAMMASPEELNEDDRIMESMSEDDDDASLEAVAEEVVAPEADSGSEDDATDTTESASAE